MNNLSLNVVVSAIDRLSTPMKKVATVTQGTEKRMARLQQQLSKAQGQNKAIERFRRLSENTQSSAKKLAEMQAKTAALAKTIQNTEKPSKRLQQQFKTAATQSKRLKENHSKQKASLERLRRELNQAGVKTTRLGTAQRAAVRQTEQLNRALDKQRNKLAMSNKLKDVGGRAGAFAGRWGMRSLIGATAIGYAFNRTFVNTAAEFERFQTILETVEGSSEKAKQSMDWISDFAAKTPYELSKVTDAYVKLRAYGLDPTNGLLTTLRDTASAMGKDLNQAVEAIADAVTGENERLKEFGIKARTSGDTITYEYTGKDGSTQTATASKSDREQIQKVLSDIFNEKFAGAMKKQSKTWNGMISNLSDQWTRFMNMVMSAGVFDWMKNKLGGFLDKINKMAASGKLQEYAERVAQMLTTGFQQLYGIGQVLWSIGSTIASVINVVAKMVGGFQNVGILIGTLVIGTLIAKITALGAALVGLSARVSQATVATSASKGGGLLGGIAGKGKGLLGKLGGKAGLAGAALGAVSIGTTLMGSGSAGEKAKAVTENVAGIGGAVGGAKLGAVIGSFILPGIGTAIGGLAGSVLGGITGGGIGKWITGLFSSDDKPESAIAKQVNKAASQPALAAAGGGVVHNNQHNNISIVQQPGEDSEALANRVVDKINEQNRINRQGGMFDNV